MKGLWDRICFGALISLEFPDVSFFPYSCILEGSTQQFVMMMNEQELAGVGVFLGFINY